MRDSIFSPSFGNRPAYLVGREVLLERLTVGLSTEPGNRERSVIILGQRGSGKTVLLWEVADRAAQKGFVVASPTIVSDGMLDRIVEKLQEAGSAYVQNESAHLSGASVGAFGFSAGLEFTHEVQREKSAQFKLTQLARRLSAQGHGILILVDELQANSDEVRKLVAVYQELIGERLNVALMLAGLPGAVSATLNDRVLTFLNRARKITADPLPLGDIDAYYLHAFERLGIALDNVTRAQLVETTHGSPYLMQLVGHHITIRATEDGVLGADAVASAIIAAQTDFENDVCATTCAALSERDVEFLEAMAEDQGESKVAQVAERMGVTVDYAQKYRKRLIDAGVIEPSRRGSVRFAVPFMAEYLQREMGR